MPQTPQRHDHPASADTQTLLAQCQVTRGRASGPGGQHRNKVETAVELLHTATGVQGAASERRSQQQNLKMATFRLRVNLAMKVRCEVPQPMTPSPLWQSRCRGGRISVNPTHEDFPSLLAEALDVVFVAGLDLKRTATILSVTPSQLIKFFKLEPAVLAMLNQERQQRQMHPLH